MVLLAGILFFLPAAYATTFSTERFTGAFDSESGVLRSLKSSLDPAFDFSPYDVFANRSGNGHYHTGDLTLRYRVGNSNGWIDADTVTNRVPLINGNSSHSILSSNLDTTIGNVTKDRLFITRTWTDYQGDLALNFTLRNGNTQSIEIGSLGLPIEFNSIFTDRTAVETREKCVLVDPFIGLQAGYVQVTRLLGEGPHLVITPLNLYTKLEAWRFLTEATDTSLAYQSQVFEGNYEWQIYTKAYADQEWEGVEPWNPPTSLVLSSGESISFGLRFTAVSSVDDIEPTVSSLGHPVAVGIPGYVVPRDLEGRLFVNTSLKVDAVNVSPDACLSLTPLGLESSSWTGYTIVPNEQVFGRCRVELVYSTGLKHTLHYYITDTGPKSLANAGQFLEENQWFTNTSDPFGRAPSIITHDRSVNGPVLQDNRVWIAGLSDEGGAGSFVTAAMKQSIQPVASEVSKLEQFVNETVWSRLQLTNGSTEYGVRKSLFYYDPNAMPDYDYDPDIYWPGSWDKDAAYLLDRAYDYVHVSALYWGLYRAGRIAPSVLTLRSPKWYLLQAYQTVLFAFGSQPDGSANTYYNDLGLMGETMWMYLLEDLRAENYTSEATKFEDIMRDRAQAWSTQEDPFGSEQAWDCTGQEGVYLWSKYFNYTATVDKTISSIRGYMPTVAHWGWNGNARRYWDFTTAGKLSRIERQIHHYGSSLNALPMLDHYRSLFDPTAQLSFYDLRIGYGGNQGPTTNVADDGFGSMSFHSFPETLAWDDYTGDYGPGFLGQVLGAGTVLVKHPEFGWVSFGGNIAASSSGGNDSVTLQPRDTVRRKVYLSDLGLNIEIDAGAIDEVRTLYGANRVEVDLVDQADGSGAVPATRAAVEYTVTSVSAAKDIRLVEDGLTKGKYGWEVKFVSGKGTVVFEW
ncbi:uncharacterized protein BO80DRAFT_471388 [Aspergillus ibericus CBS 121593]|uniref:Glycoside hydrolase family 43 protein n=1 Tax=Aspergillus ibericus CBS 121593 TaxID=1448316 RepID=A0A395H553_9EURO|nr:hypothetical protein BO80DRAFT_471388 [Aspergillus ibericus CBS 121593]RAL02816.1 hypothetical protein BO80DRAFT_471388 [Aspergillus ibericus CBS 121593]